MKTDQFGKAKIRMSYAQAKRVLSLIQEYHDFSKLTVGDVLELNDLTIQLEELIKEKENDK
jgi:hypothetical protein